MRIECCVYGIQNTSTGKWYVGSTTRRSHRWGDHLRMLRQKRHHAPKLQASFERHGEAAFRFEVLQRCPPAELATCEQLWLDLLRAHEHGYNTLARTDMTDPMLQSARSKKRWVSDEQRQRQSERIAKLWQRPGWREQHAARMSKVQTERWRRYREANT